MTGKKSNGAGEVVGTDKTLWGAKGERINVPRPVPEEALPGTAPGAGSDNGSDNGSGSTQGPTLKSVDYDGPMQMNVQPQILNNQPIVNVSLYWKVKGEDTITHATAALDVPNAVIIAASIHNAVIEAQVEAQVRVESQFLQAWLTQQSRSTNAMGVPDVAWAMNQMRNYREFKEAAAAAINAMREEALGATRSQEAGPEGGTL